MYHPHHTELYIANIDSNSENNFAREKLGFVLDLNDNNENGKPSRILFLIVSDRFRSFDTHVGCLPCIALK